VPTQSERLVGSIIKYDASMHSHSAQADLVVKLRSKGGNQIRPPSFTPPVSDSTLRLQSLSSYCQEMFSNGALVWTFHVHAPHNREEEKCLHASWQAIRSRAKRFVEVEPFVSVPGHEGENIPKPESLLCSIIEGWGQESQRLVPAPPCNAHHRDTITCTTPTGSTQDPAPGCAPSRASRTGLQTGRVGHFNVEDVTPGCLLTSTEITGGAPLLGREKCRTPYYDAACWCTFSRARCWHPPCLCIYHSLISFELGLARNPWVCPEASM